MRYLSASFLSHRHDLCVRISSMCCYLSQKLPGTQCLHITHNSKCQKSTAFIRSDQVTGWKKDVFFHAFWSGYILRYSGPYCIVKESCAVLRATASAMRVLHRGQHNTPSEGARASFKPLEARNSPNPRACFLVSKATAKGFTEGAGHRPRIPASRH